MRRGEVPAEDRQVRNAIIGLLQEREHLYGWVWLRTFLFGEPNSDKWRHAVTRIEVLQKGEEKPEEVQWEYERGILRKTAISQEDFIRILDAVLQEGQLALPGMPSVAIEGGFSWKAYLYSKALPLSFPWPGNYYQFREDSPPGLPGGPFVALPYPAFSDSHTLVQEQLGIDPTRESGVFYIILPNYLARIEALKIGSHRLIVTVKTQGIPLDVLLGKLHVTESRGARSLHCDVVFEQETQILPLDFVPGHVYVGLLSKEKGDLFDFRRFHAASLGLYPEPVDVEWEPLAEEEIDILLFQGENERVEFKLDLGKGEELAETVVAFANKTGGIILVGVDDRANVMGYTGQQPENTVRNILRRYCEPPIDPLIEMKEARGKPVLVIRVKEGFDKPYTHREKGVIVRVGSTDRVATRDELDVFYQQKYQQKEKIRGLFGPGS